MTVETTETFMGLEVKVITETISTECNEVIKVDPKIIEEMNKRLRGE